MPFDDVVMGGRSVTYLEPIAIFDVKCGGVDRVNFSGLIDLLTVDSFSFDSGVISLCA